MPQRIEGNDEGQGTSQGGPEGADIEKAMSPPGTPAPEPVYVMNEQPASKYNVTEVDYALEEEVVEEEHYDEMLMSLWNRCESERQMQTLAATYFHFRHFWVLFLPGALLTMAASTLAFLSSSRILESHTDTLTTIVGCLALIAGFFQTLNNFLKWNVRAEMHTSAAYDLKKIVDDLEFIQVVRTGSTKQQQPKTLKTFQQLYGQIMLGCKSEKPIQIASAYKTIETRVLMELPPDTDRKPLEGQISIAKLMSIVHSELYCVFSRYYLWPLKERIADSAMKQALQSVRTYLKTSAICEGAKELENQKNLSIGKILRTRRNQVAPLSKGH